MLNYYYRDNLESFIFKSTEEIFGEISLSNEFDTSFHQNKSWEQQIKILKRVFKELHGEIFFEFSIPRMGSRVDTIVIINDIIFVIEFKVGENKYNHSDIEQVWDYSLDLKNFHEPSHNAILVPILVATDAKRSFIEISTTSHNDNLLLPIRTNEDDLSLAIEKTCAFFGNEKLISADRFAKGAYHPTPTIIEAAVALYNNHTVEGITRNDAEAINLTLTTSRISELIDDAKKNNKKIICFVTGVPGAGKTLVGLNVATSHLDKEKGNASVYLSGNAPLVSILQEALTRNKILRESEIGNKLRKKDAKQSVKAFIQIIHHYRDAYLINKDAPYDHVAIFDEAQRAWNKEQTVKFMKQKKNQPNFDYSEPEFLISCLDRHLDWAVIVCLVGGGQEINTGEAGISEWLNAVYNRFYKWEVCISPNLTDSEYSAEDSIKLLRTKCKLNFVESLHLSVSLRSFRAEHLSFLIKKLLDMEINSAKSTLLEIANKYPIVITRNINRAKDWLKEKARGSERYGIVVSSQAQRLKPLAIDVKSPINPVYWFLNDKEDVRSSFFLEDVATEFHVQGLELDWACVTWDGDLRYSESGWKTFSFKGNKWQMIHNPERKKYLINAYRVLLTRARHGMVIVVPDGNQNDHTRRPEYYDSTFKYLMEIGFKVI